MKELNEQIRTGFENLLFMSTLLSNEDLMIHIKEIQNDIKHGR